ncbi:MAG: hypothetical protein L0H64_07465 [Pseudonocardia sp.]|nr:hypothetical protein [Pseudonocardia sp.]
MSKLDDIPTAVDAPVDARPSAVVARIRAIRPSRRTVLRGLVIAAAAAALVPLDWYLLRREAAAQEAEGDDKSEHTSCQPENYREEANNWPSTGPAVCYGGWRRGGYPCADGYHREGAYSDGVDSFESTRVTTSCHGRNAWRWNGYRCSDAMTTATFADGTEYNGISIAACALPEGASPAPSDSGSDEPGSSGPDAPAEPSDAGDDGGSGGTDPGTSDDGVRPGTSDDDGSGDPSRPLRLLPSLGSSSGLGSLFGAR